MLLLESSESRLPVFFEVTTRITGRRETFSILPEMLSAVALN